MKDNLLVFTIKATMLIISAIMVIATGVRIGMTW